MREWSMVSMVRSVSGWSDGGLSIVFTAFRVSHIAQTILPQRFKFDGSIWFADAEEWNIITSLDINSVLNGIILNITSSAVLVKSDSRGQWFPALVFNYPFVTLLWCCLSWQVQQQREDDHQTQQ